MPIANRNHDSMNSFQSNLIECHFQKSRLVRIIANHPIANVMKENQNAAQKAGLQDSAFDQSAETAGKGGTLTPPAFQLKASPIASETENAAPIQQQADPSSTRSQGAPIQRSAENAAIGAGVGALGGAAIGAGIGSVVPGIGTGIGALAGGLIGGLVGGIAGALTGNTSSLVQAIDQSIAANETYDQIKAKILAASAGDRASALADQRFLGRLKTYLGWENFSRSVESLGRVIPDYAALSTNATVTAELDSAWRASNPQVPAGANRGHEEGGWIYLNIVTGAITTRRGPTGGQADVNLDNPPVVADSVVVGVFHTHPNLGPGWAPGPSPADIRIDARDGIPDIVVGSPTNDPNAYVFYQSGPNARLHLGGGQGYPGSTGGNRPQQMNGQEAQHR